MNDIEKNQIILELQTIRRLCNNIEDIINEKNKKLYHTKEIDYYLDKKGDKK